MSNPFDDIKQREETENQEKDRILREALEVKKKYHKKYSPIVREVLGHLIKALYHWASIKDISSLFPLQWEVYSETSDEVETHYVLVVLVLDAHGIPNHFECHVYRNGFSQLEKLKNIEGVHCNLTSEALVRTLHRLHE